MFRKIHCLVFGLGLLTSVIIPGAVSAQAADNASSGSSLVATQVQLEVIKGLWGKHISVAEYYEAVFPGELAKMLKGLPQSMHKYLYETEWYWPPVAGVPTYGTLPSTAAEPAGQSGIRLQSGTLDSTVDVFMYSPQPVVVAAEQVAHGAAVYTSPVTNMPYLSVASYLYFWGDNGSELKSSASYWLVGASQIDCYGLYQTTIDGLYCNVTSCSFVSPPGYIPPYGGFGGGSGWWWLSP